MSNNHKSNVIHINDQERENKTFSLTEKNKLLESCKSITSQHLKKQLQYMFDNVDDFLFDLADKSDTSDQQTLYFDAMREIRLQKDFMEHDFHEQFSLKYTQSLDSLTGYENSGMKGHNAFSSNVMDEMLLVEDDELEELLAITNMISKSQSQFRELIYALDQRYGYLLDVTDIKTEDNPIGPGNVCHAFKKSVGRINADLKIKLIVYKLFDRYVAQHFDSVYEEVNKTLAFAGVLPNIKIKIQKSKTSSNRSTPSASTASEQAGSAQFNPITGHVQNSNVIFNDASGAEIFSTLQSLLNNQRTDATGAPGTGNSTGNTSNQQSQAPTFQSSDILKALSLLQNSTAIAGHSGDTIKTEITQEMGKILDDIESRSINTPDTDSIDIVAMLFDFILGDKNLPDSMKALIGRLQIPVLKVVIMDKTFFGKRSHPVRKMLNELANAEIGGKDGEDLENDPLFQKIKYIIERIINEFDDDILIFSELLNEYYDFKQEEQNKIEEAKEALLNAKITVTKEIGERIVFTIPDSIRCFITEVWKDVLTEVYLRDKKKSVGWMTALQLMDDLIWSVQPKSSKEDQQKLIKIIPKVLQGLQVGLTLINYDPVEKETLMRGLQRIHIASLKGEIADDNMKNVENENKLKSESTIDALEVDDDQISDDTFYRMALTKENQDSDMPLLEDSSDLEPTLDEKFIHIAKNIELGKWLEFSDQDGNKTRGKLAWKSDVMGEFTFVDRKYSVVADKTTLELATELSQGKATIIDNLPLFDRALDAVVSGLKKVTQKNKTVDWDELETE